MVAPSSSHALRERLKITLEARQPLFDNLHKQGLRLFNGFYEGFPDLVIDLFGRTLVLHNYGNPPENSEWAITTAREYYLENLPWLESGLLKIRNAVEYSDRQGVVLFGTTLDQQIEEFGVKYALDLMVNQDTSFYLDTRLLRGWLLENMATKTVLITFAYTGSLGVAARAAGAKRVIFTDHNQRYLNLAKTSFSLNRFAIDQSDFQISDFFPFISRMKRSKQLFDCVILDPPIYSTTPKGTVDMLRNSHRVINKVRPLINAGGYLVVINNAVFLSGAEYLAILEDLCRDGYLSLETLIPIPLDCTGFPQTCTRQPPADPAPFNHPTKIVVLKVKRKTMTGST